MKDLNNYERGFIEGFLDADGCIVILRAKDKKYKRGWSAHVKIAFTNNSKEILKKIQKILNTGKIYKSGGISITGNQSYKLTCYQNDCRWILPQLKLVIKEDKRKLAINILKLIKDKSLIPRETYEKILEDLLP